MFIDDVLANRKSQARALTWLFGSKKWISDSIQEIVRYPAASILDFNNHLALNNLCVNCYGSFVFN